MNDAEFITILIMAIGAVAIPVVKFYFDLRKERDARGKDRELIKALTEYVSAQREHLGTLQAQISEDRHLKESGLELARERLEWDQLVAAAKTLGWVLEKSGLLEGLQEER
jgi:hypothetical protein